MQTTAPHRKASSPTNVCFEILIELPARAFGAFLSLFEAIA